MLAGMKHRGVVSTLGILEMPFLDMFEIQDYIVVRFLEDLSVEWDGRYLQQVLNHPSFSGGITDMDTVILTALFGIARLSWENQEIGRVCLFYWTQMSAINKSGQ